jgi:RNA polymerase sigma-70 factor (ECF subfamily)
VTTDAARFEAFVEEYQDMVFATAVRLLGRESDAEDVAQTVFMRAFERFGELADSPAVAGWLKTVTTNLCLNHLKRYRSRWKVFSEVEREYSGPSLEDRIARLTAGPAERDAVERMERAEHLERSLRALPDHQRVPLVLFHFEELSYQEIAEKLAVSLSKVKSDIHRGREALKQELRGTDGTV